MAQKDLSGVLYPQKERTKETSPHFYGYATLSGVEYKISAWKNSGDKGPYVSLKFQLASGVVAATAPNSAADPFDLGTFTSSPVEPVPATESDGLPF